MSPEANEFCVYSNGLLTTRSRQLYKIVPVTQVFRGRFWLLYSVLLLYKPIIAFQITVTRLPRLYQGRRSSSVTVDYLPFKIMSITNQTYQVIVTLENPFLDLSLLWPFFIISVKAWPKICWQHWAFTWDPTRVSGSSVFSFRCFSNSIFERKFSYKFSDMFWRWWRKFETEFFFGPKNILLFLHRFLLGFQFT